jgi:BMFP domain-containing protein YqiC
MVTVTTRTRLELATDRIDELEAVLAAVLED